MLRSRANLLEFFVTASFFINASLVFTAETIFKYIEKKMLAECIVDTYSAFMFMLLAM